MFSNLLPGNDSFAAIRCNENVISEPLLSNERLDLAPVLRFSAVMSQESRRRDNQTLFIYCFQVTKRVSPPILRTRVTL
jgi:hypothetical protein